MKAELAVRNTRVLNAPRHIVFKAIAESDHLKNWWGPKGFTNTFHVFEFLEGGKWSFIMHGPDKGNYPNESVFLKINEPASVEFDHISDPKFRVRIELNEVNLNQTEFIFQMHFDSEELYQKLKGHVPEKNEENIDRLETELMKMQGII